MKKKIFSLFIISVVLVLTATSAWFLVWKNSKETDNLFPEDGKALAAVMVDGRWGFIDRWGNMIIEPNFKEVGEFSDGLVPVKTEEKWGFVNASGEMVIEPFFDTYEKYFLDEFCLRFFQWSC